MTVDFNNVLYPGQKPLLAAMVARERPVILLGGGSGGGKSFTLRATFVAWHLLLHSLGLKGVQTVIFADTIPNVRDRFHSKFESEYGPSGTVSPGLGSMRQSGSSGYAFYFKNPELGAIWLRSWEHDPFALRGKELAAVGFDESTQLMDRYESESAIQLLRIGARFPGSPSLPVVLTSNWDGVGLAWHKRMFFDRTDFHGVDPEDVSYIPLLIDDNKNEEFVRIYKPTLESLTGNLRDSRLLGIPTIPVGAAFPEADRRVQGFNLYETFPTGIPIDWVRILHIDWGFAAPFCALWTAISPCGSKAYTYRERYQARLLDHEQADLIVSSTLPDERIEMIYVDPAMRQRRTDTQSGRSLPSVYDTYKNVFNADLRFGRIVGGDNRSRIKNFGWLRQGLSRSPGTPWEWHIERGCTWLWAELENAVFDSSHIGREEDITERSSDHALTAAAYGLRTHLDKFAKHQDLGVADQLASIVNSSENVNSYSNKGTRERLRAATSPRKWDVG